MRDEASYICDSCGEDIVVPIDWSGGSRQSYVEDCPVCCNPNVIHVELDDGDSRPVDVNNIRMLPPDYSRVGKNSIVSCYNQ